MKKILLTLVGLIATASFVVNAQGVAKFSEPVEGQKAAMVQSKDVTVVYSEGFEPGNDTGALPEGWTQKKADNAVGNNLVDLVDGDTRWWRYSELYDMGYTSGYNADWIHTGEASLHVNWNVEAEQNLYAITPAINIDGSEDLTLEFWMYFPSDYPTELNVLLELDGVWEVLAEYNSTDNENLYTSALELDLTGKVGSARIAFVYKWTDGIQMNIDDVSIYGPNVTSSVEFSQFDNLAAYPNPFTNEITVNDASKIERVVVYNLIGQEVMNVKMTNNTINTSDLSSGVYVVAFQGANGERAIRKMIKR